MRSFTRKNGQVLTLSDEALEHIINGEFSSRPIGNGATFKILKGGLHTYNGWKKFKRKHNEKIAHLHIFNSLEHDSWYYAREFGNGVIALRLPKDLFSGKAAKMTMYPDEYYKSGYLWKTLFPKNYDEEKILKSINEALSNEDIDQSQSGQIIGYTDNKDPLKIIKLVIQHRGNKINSAFPSWTQPNTGNNGKPYSHYDNIGFTISQSTVYLDEYRSINFHRKKFNFCEPPANIDELYEYTPDLFKSRTPPKKGENWTEKRIQEIESTHLNDKEDEIIVKYLNDFNIIKYYPELSSFAFAYNFKDICSSKSIFNTFFISQNLIDGLNYLKIRNDKKNLLKTIDFMLKNMVSHTMFDLFNKKRILSTILEIVYSLNDPELSYNFILNLSKSPVRRELYLEFNLETLKKKRLLEKAPLEEIPDEFMTVYLTGSRETIDIEYNDIVELFKEILGETYSITFKEKELTEHIIEIIKTQSENYEYLVKLSIPFLSRSDFNSLPNYLEDILESAISYKDGNKTILIDSVGLILRDYCRIQFAHRQRINFRYLKYYNFTDDLYLPVDENLILGVILKHERLTNIYRLEEITEVIINFSEKHSENNLKSDALNFKNKIGKEKAPLPDR